MQTGLSYSAKGRKFSRINPEEVAAQTDTLFERNDVLTNYIEFPLLLSYNLKGRGKKQFQLSTGPYGAFFLNGRSIRETRSFNANKYVREEEEMAAGSGRNTVRTFDLGWAFSGRVDFGKFTLSAFHHTGFTKAYTNAKGNGFKHSVTGLSIGLWILNEVQKKPKDSDQDGILDEEDHCPLLPGTALTKGCPDKDGDGIADHNDQCPEAIGVERYKGCPVPDTDRDGLNDEEDSCPKQEGTARYQGCPIPDRDKDGLNDETDQCPDIFGKSTYQGCPVPDSDGDGLDDENDKCPQVKGIKEENGCPLTIQRVEQKIEFAAKNIFFAPYSSIIDHSSFTALDEVIALLNEFSDLRLLINGHTDNTGDPAENQKISQQRADAVKAYMVNKLIDPRRITAKGFGQTQPLSPNTTPEGRAINRRVEMKVKK